MVWYGMVQALCELIAKRQGFSEDVTLQVMEILRSKFQSEDHDNDGKRCPPSFPIFYGICME